MQEKKSKRLFPIIMTDDMLKELKLDAVKNDRSAASLIRELIKTYLKGRSTNA